MEARAYLFQLVNEKVMFRLLVQKRLFFFFCRDVIGTGIALRCMRIVCE